MKIVEYKTATGGNLPDLDTDVNKLIDEGFEPHGNPYFANWGEIQGIVDTMGFFQAMVRRKAE